MQETNIDEIIRAVLTGVASKEDSARLNQWLSESDENRRVFEQIQQVWDTRADEPQLSNAAQIRDHIWERGLQEEGPFLHKPKSTFSYYAKLAAMVLLVLSGVLFIFIYHTPAADTYTTVRIITKKSTAGQKLKVLLPDGSLAWLNAESRISYAENFGQAHRQIELSGEGYFEVKKNPKKPFVVLSGKVSTTALGTSFNIAAYPEDSTIQVALLSGQVKVETSRENKSTSSYFLQKGNGIDYNKNTNSSTAYLFNERSVMAWKQGILVFEGDSFEQVQKKLERWYGVDITLKGSPPQDWKLAGKFTNQPLSAVLENIRFGRNFTYTLTNKQLVFYFKTPKS